MHPFFQDLRFALRQLLRNPGFALVAVITLALGIGANTAVFSAVNAVLLQPLPYAHPGRLMAVFEESRRGTPHPGPISYPDFLDWRAENHSFAHLVSYRDDDFSVGGGARPLHVTGEIVSWDLLPALGVKPMLGRGFLKSEETAGQRVVLLSAHVWKEQFGGDPAIVGRTIELDRKPATVVGVMPASFRFPVESPNVGFWTTLAVDAVSTDGPALTAQRGAHTVGAIGLLKPGVSAAQAQSELAAIEAGLSRKYASMGVWTAWVEPEITRVIGPVRPALLMLLGAVGLVLLIACANIASLLLARSASREREIAVRASVGASRGRLVRQLLTESLLLGVLGSAAGVVLAGFGLRALMHLAGDSVPRLGRAGLDGRVLGFALLLAFVTSLLFGLMPALRVSRVDLNASLKDGARGATGTADRLRNALVVAQVAVGLVVLTGAGLLAASFVHLSQSGLGFNPNSLLTFSYDLPETQYTDAASTRFAQQLLQRIRALPGVSSAAGVLPLPMSGHGIGIAFNIQHRPSPPGQEPVTGFSVITPGYFHTMEIPVVQGRDFGREDIATSTPVAVVNQAFAQQFFPGKRLLGTYIEPEVYAGNGKPQMHQIVGVVADSKNQALAMKPRPMLYLVYPQLPWGSLSVVARTAVPPHTLDRAMRAQVAALDPQEPVYHMTTMNELVSVERAQPRFQMVLLASFALLALLLMLVGLYGVMSWAVARRRREIGVRMALGARRATVLGMILKQAATLLGLGVALGVAGSLASARALESLLYGVPARNPMVTAAVCGLVVAAGLVAAWIPAVRAASVDPMEALRTE